MLNKMEALEMFMFKYVAILSVLLITNSSYAAEPYKVGDIFYCVETEMLFAPSKSVEYIFIPERDLERFMFKIVDKQTLSFGEGARTATVTNAPFLGSAINSLEAKDGNKNIILNSYYEFKEVIIKERFQYMITAECEKI